MSALSALADKLDSQREELLDRWLKSVEEQLRPAGPLTRPELQDSLPQFLDEVTASLRRGGPTRGIEEQTPTTEVARGHGRQRYRLGFNLHTVVWEYSLLRDLLFDLMEESGLPYTMNDVRVLSYAVASGVAGAVEQFSQEREADMRASHAEVARARDNERQLIGIVSHDLRNPLAAILMSAEVVLRSSGLSGMTGQALHRLKASAERATRLIGDLLDFARERVAGQIPIKPEPADLGEIVRESVAEAAFSFPGRGVEHEERGPLRGRWDPHRLYQLVANLLINALKFSPADSVVRVTTAGDADGVTLTVHNEGPPIASDRMKTLFDPLQDAEPGGSGKGTLKLGLHIARQIALGHGGTIEVRSSAEEGTTFTVRLPRAPAAAAKTKGEREGEG